MTRYRLFLVFIFFSALFSCNKKQDYEKNIRQQFQAMSEAFLKGDYSTYVSFIYPKAIDGMGGKDKSVELLQKIAIQMVKDSDVIHSMTIGSISSPVTAGKEIHCLVTQSIEMKVKGGTQITETAMIAISEDMGKNWTFVDVTNVDMERLKALLPNFNDNLKIPPHKAPVFIPDRK